MIANETTSHQRLYGEDASNCQSLYGREQYAKPIPQSTLEKAPT